MSLRDRIINLTTDLITVTNGPIVFTEDVVTTLHGLETVTGPLNKVKSYEIRPEVLAYFKRANFEITTKGNLFEPPLRALNAEEKAALEAVDPISYNEYLKEQVSHWPFIKLFTLQTIANCPDPVQLELHDNSDTHPQFGCYLPVGSGQSCCVFRISPNMIIESK